MTDSALNYKIFDITLADWGRKEIDIAEKCGNGCEKYSHSNLQSVYYHRFIARTIKPLHIETGRLGADVRWASCNIFPQDHAAAIAAKGIPVFAWKAKLWGILVVYNQALTFQQQRTSTHC